MISTGVPKRVSGSTFRMSSDSTLVDAAVGVLVEQGLEHGAGLVAVLGEDVALLHLVGALAARERRLVEGDVADEVEGVVVAARPARPVRRGTRPGWPVLRGWPACGRRRSRR